jgi:hypothetical protein
MRRLLAAAACHSQAWPWSEARRYAYAFVVGEIIMHSHMLACKLIFKSWLQLLHRSDLWFSKTLAITHSSCDRKRENLIAEV